MTSYSATVINKNIGHLFLSPFLHWLSPLDPVRIQEEVELEMLRKRVRGMSRHGILPDQYRIRINSDLYHRHVLQLPSLAEKLVRHIQEFARREKLHICKYPVDVQFESCSHIGGDSLEVRACFSEQGASSCPPLFIGWHIHPRGHPEQAKCIEIPGDYGIGRNDKSWYRIDNPYVSNFHAVLRLSKKSELFIHDFKSSNGTFCNDERVIRDNPVHLQKGDFIRLGVIKGCTLIVR